MLLSLQECKDKSIFELNNFSLCRVKVGNCLKCSKLFKVEIIYLIFCKNWLITWHNCCWFSFLWGLKYQLVLLFSNWVVTFGLHGTMKSNHSCLYTQLIWCQLFEIPINILSSRSDTQSKFAWNSIRQEFCLTHAPNHHIAW